MQTYCVLIPGSDANRLLMLTYRMWKNKKCPNTQRSMVVGWRRLLDLLDDLVYPACLAYLVCLAGLGGLACLADSAGPAGFPYGSHCGFSDARAGLWDAGFLLGLA